MINKKTTTLLAIVLIAVFAAGVFASQVIFPPKYVYVTVEEAISIDPEFVSVTLFVGESGSADFTIHNLASVDIPLTVLAEVTAYPEGAVPADLTLTYSETLTAIAAGDTTLTIDFSLTTGIIPGDYTITITVTRI